MREGTGKWVTVRLNTTFDESIEIPLLATNGDGVTSEDYSGVPASVVFKPGEATKSFRFVAAADEIFESDEAIDIAFGQLPTGLRSTRPSSARVVIQERLDEPMVQIGNGLAYENHAEMTFEVNLSLPSSEEVSVRWQTEDGDAIAGEDYEAASGVATFAPGLTGPLVVRVPIINDSYSEANETFTVEMSDPKNGRAGSVATGAIIDDDSREVEITPQNLAVQEGQTASYTVVLGSAPTEAVTVTMTTVGETDLLLSPGTVVFDHTDWNTPRTIAVGAPDDDDALVEPPVAIQHGVSGGDYDQLPAPTVTVTIAEKDFALASVADVQAGEGDGEIVFVMELDNPTNRTVTFQWETRDRTATASSDYIGGQGQLTLPPLETRRELVFQLLDDELNEPVESFALELSAVTNAVLSVANATGTILDDDPVAVSIAAVQDRLVEGETVRFNLVRVGDLTVPVVVPVEVTQVGNVIKGNPPTIATFAMGSATAVLTVTTENDQLDEPDARVEARILGGDGHVVDGPESASVTVEDDDLPSVSIVPVASEVREGEAARFSVVRVGQLTEALQVGVEVNQVGEVISGLPPSTVTFAVGADVAQLIVATQDDEVDEPDGVVQARLEEANSYAVSAAGSASVVVTDNDLPIVGLAAEAERVEEGGAAQFNVTRAGDLTVPLTIPVEVSQVGEVISGKPPEAVTFEIGAHTAVLMIATEDDSLDEPDGMIEVRIAAANGYILSARSSASIIIADNDLPTISIVAPVAQVREGDDVRFDLTRVGQLTESLIVPVVVDQVGDVIEGTPPSSASFAVGSATAFVIVPTADDELDEADGIIEVRIPPGDDHEVSGESSATVTVTDNDLPSVSIVAVEDQVTEGDEARFNVIRVGDLAVALDVPVEVGQTGDVLSGVPPTSVSFETGADTAVLVVETQDDDLDEEDGMVEAALSEAGGHVVAGAGDAMVAVADNDAAPTVTILGAQALERTGEIVFSVALGGPSGRNVSVDWATSDGTAIAIDDYGSETGTLVIAPGRMADTIRIAIVDDLLDEESETFSVSLDALVNILPGTVTATGTILDDDLPVAKAWLSRFGRTVATQVVDAVSERVFRDYGPGGEYVLGGANHADAGWADLITGSSFRYSTVGQVGQGGAPRGWTVWGRGASTRFSGAETEMSLDGGVVSGFVGVDFRQGPLLAGLLLSHSRGDGDYSGNVLDVDGRRLVSGGELGSSLTGVHPYLRINVNDRIATWGLLGRGWGNMTISEGGHDTGIGMNLGAVGARGTLVSPGGSGFGLALLSDAFYTGLSSERSAGGLPAEDVSVNRVRLAVEGSRDMVTGNGTRVGLSVEAGVRRDGGDAETGTGVEMGGRIRYANPRQGLSLEATARGLIAHQNADYEEWGVAGSLLFDPGRSEQGFSMRMRTAWGSVFGGVNQLWSQESVRGLSRGRLRGGNEPEINAELNYGLAIRSDETLMTPFATISLAGGQTAAYRLGWRVKVGPTFRLSLANTIGGDANRGSLARGLQLRGSFRREQ